VTSTAPEKPRQKIAQHLLPVDSPAGNVVELIFEVGGEIVFDIAFEKAGEERGHRPAAVLGDEAPLVEIVTCRPPVGLLPLSVTDPRPQTQHILGTELPRVPRTVAAELRQADFKASTLVRARLKSLHR
jgi:hypothetical protein